MNRFTTRHHQYLQPTTPEVVLTTAEYRHTTSPNLLIIKIYPKEQDKRANTKEQHFWAKAGTQAPAYKQAYI